MADGKLRIAIVNEDRCKPKKCRQECKKKCPSVQMGNLCIEVSPNTKTAIISEILCIGCGACVKACPFNAIQIVNLPKSIANETTHRYGANSFKLHRLPMPRAGQVLGLVGTNGIGKSTALGILSGKVQPNLGKYGQILEWNEILKYFRGSELQNYFGKIKNDELKAVTKPQFVEQVPKVIRGTVASALTSRNSTLVDQRIAELELGHLLTRNIADLSGGELQRFCIAMVCLSPDQVFIFDEPSSYLDVKQRLSAAKVIRSMTEKDKYVIVAEHDLALLDYLSDFICCLYGKPGAYGVVTMPFSVREGINIFLDGYIPPENMRFRDESLDFHLAVDTDIAVSSKKTTTYPKLEKKFSEFILTIEPGSFSESEILVLLGQNGTGKTSFLKLLAGKIQPEVGDIPELKISYKPQMITPTFNGTVRQLIHSRISEVFFHQQFQSDLVKPLNIEDLMDQQVLNLSGGELQRVAIILALGQVADVYLLDEPSTYLDVEQRIIVAKAIKRFILHARKTAFIVEHDLIMATYLADRVVIFEGEPGIKCIAKPPEGLVSGMNRFLKNMGVTFRRDPSNFRPRINKEGSVRDREQKAAGIYFSVEA